jgi:hypothetical protein
MSIVEKVERLLHSGVLRRALVFVPEMGASQHVLYEIESLSGAR